MTTRGLKKILTMKKATTKVSRMSMPIENVAWYDYTEEVVSIEPPSEEQLKKYRYFKVKRVFPNDTEDLTMTCLLFKLDIAGVARVPAWYDEEVKMLLSVKLSWLKAMISMPSILKRILEDSTIATLLNEMRRLAVKTNSG